MIVFDVDEFANEHIWPKMFYPIFNRVELDKSLKGGNYYGKLAMGPGLTDLSLMYAHIRDGDIKLI